ncbi:hypothetical protein [uncultured Photobacterium sp.]|uniref:hypothetical protein n=1 Tax=uncultured Photobacterium sp. TaxID=173973 RepID=UPI002639178D|nr:hypothetical protein [uncultured Photobacterium sp.]
MKHHTAGLPDTATKGLSRMRCSADQSQQHSAHSSAFTFPYFGFFADFRFSNFS